MEKPPRGYYQDQGYGNKDSLPPTVDDELLLNVQNSDDLADIASSYLSRQIMFHTQLQLDSAHLDQLFKLIHTVADENARYLFDFILDYNSKLRDMGGDLAQRNHSPVIWLLTELLKLYTEPLGDVCLCLMVLDALVSIEDNVRAVFDCHTVGVVLGSMAAQAHVEDVQLHGSRILSRLAKFIPDPSRKAMVREAAVEILVQAIKHFKENLDISLPSLVAVVRGSETLRKVSRESQRSEEMRTMHHEALHFVRATSTPVVLEMKTTFPNHEIVQKECQRFLDLEVDSTSSGDLGITAEQKDFQEYSVDMNGENIGAEENKIATTDSHESCIENEVSMKTTCAESEVGIGTVEESSYSVDRSCLEGSGMMLTVVSLAQHCDNPEENMGGKEKNEDAAWMTENVGTNGPAKLDDIHLDVGGKLDDLSVINGSGVVSIALDNADAESGQMETELSTASDAVVNRSDASGHAVSEIQTEDDAYTAQIVVTVTDSELLETTSLLETVTVDEQNNENLLSSSSMHDVPTVEPVVENEEVCEVTTADFSAVIQKLDSQGSDLGVESNDQTAGIDINVEAPDLDPAALKELTEICQHVVSKADAVALSRSVDGSLQPNLPLNESADKDAKSESSSSSLDLACTRLQLRRTTYCVQAPTTAVTAPVLSPSSESIKTNSLSAGTSISSPDCCESHELKVLSDIEDDSLEKSLNGGDSSNDCHSLDEDSYSLSDCCSEGHDTFDTMATLPPRSVSCPGLDKYYQSLENSSDEDDVVGDDAVDGPRKGRRGWGSIHPPDVESLLQNRSPSMIAECMEEAHKFRRLHLPPSHSEPDICSSLERRGWDPMPLNELLYLEEKSLESRSEVSSGTSQCSEADEEGIIDYLLSQPHGHLVQLLVCRTQVLLYVLSYWNRKRYLTVFDILGRPVLRVLEDVRLPAETADFARSRQTETVHTSFVSILNQITKIDFMTHKMKQKLLVASEKLLVQPLTPTLIVRVCLCTEELFRKWKQPDKKSIQSLISTIGKLQKDDDIDDGIQSRLNHLLALVEPYAEK